MSYQVPIAKELLDEITKWINHRERMMMMYGAFKSLQRISTITTLRTQLEAVRMQNTAIQCRMVLQLLGDLYSIAAGKASRYYHSDQCKIIGWEEVASTYVQPNNSWAEATGDVTRGISHDPVASFSYLPNTPL